MDTKSQIRYSLRIQLEVKFRNARWMRKWKTFILSRTHYIGLKLLDNVVVMLHNFISFRETEGRLHVSMLHKYWRNVCLLTIISSHIIVGHCGWIIQHAQISITSNMKLLKVITIRKKSFEVIELIFAFITSHTFPPRCKP